MCCREESDGERLHSNPRDYAWGPSGLDNIISQLLTQFGDNGPPPAEQEKIDNLPTISINAENEGNKCPTYGIVSDVSVL